MDIQPADIIGVRVYDQTKKEFILRRGPIFTNLLMVDEINRLTPKTQSALLEALSEGQTTIDGVTYPLANPYFTIATQNPYEAEGTFPLIDAQRDRFMFSFILSHLDAESELEILRRERAGDLDWKIYHDRIAPILGPADIKDMIATVREVMIDEKVLEYARDIILATRAHSDIVHGASSRASIAFLRGARARAAIEGRDYAIPDDVRALAHPILRHRILLTREAAITGTDLIRSSPRSRASGCPSDDQPTGRPEGSRHLPRLAPSPSSSRRRCNPCCRLHGIFILWRAGRFIRDSDLAASLRWTERRPDDPPAGRHNKRPSPG